MHSPYATHVPAQTSHYYQNACRRIEITSDIKKIYLPFCFILFRFFKALFLVNTFYITFSLGRNEPILGLGSRSYIINNKT